jgi:ketose-bisphosphate aldolase
MKAKEVIKKARKERKCIPAFNIPHLAMIKPIVQAIVDENSIGMIQVARVEWEKMSSKSLEHVADEYQLYKNEKHTLLHLDHIPVVDEDEKKVDYMSYLKRAISCGYQSVMIDGSRLPFDDNLQATREATYLAHESNIPCEGELGAVMGHESKVLPSYEEIFASKLGYTDVDEAIRFTAETKCDWLSIAAGNIHGAVAQAVRNQKKPEARLDVEHISRLYGETNVPLVLHGGSGIKVQYILDGISVGIAKINVGTELRQTFEFAVAEKENDIIYAQHKVYLACRNYIAEVLENTNLKDRLGV